MSSVTVNLDSVLNIARAESLHNELETLEKKSVPVNFNVSQVSRVDTAILQLLLAFIRRMRESDLEVVWSGVTDEFRASAELLGLATELNFDN